MPGSIVWQPDELLDCEGVSRLLVASEIILACCELKILPVCSHIVGIGVIELTPDLELAFGNHASVWQSDLHVFLVMAIQADLHCRLIIGRE